MTDLVPVIILVTSVWAIALALPHRDYGPLGSAPMALTAVIGGSTAIGVVAAFTGVSLLSQPWLVWAIVSVLVVWAIVHRRRTAAMSWAVAPTLAASAGGVMLTMLALVMGLLDPARRLNWFLDADNVRHVVYAADVWANGGLAYSTESYPRGWHTTQALLWSSADPALVPASVVGLLTVSALSFWLAFATLALTCGVLSVRLAEASSGAPRSQIIAGLAGGAAPLWISFSGVYLANGYQTSVIAGLAVATALLEVVGRSSRRRALVATSLAAMVVAHSWQILLPVVALLMCVAIVQSLRNREPHTQGGSRRWALGVAAVIGASLVVSWPALWAALTDIGLSHGREADVVAPMPAVWVVLGVLVSLWVLASRRRRIAPLAVSAAAVLASASLGVGLAAVLGIPVTQYYPSKTLWQAAVLAIPLVCAMATVWLAEAMRRVTVRPLKAVIAAAGGALVLAWLAFPATVLLGGWSSVDAASVLRAITSPRAAEADVVWTDDREDDTISRILLDVYRVDATRERTIQHPAGREELCQILIDSDAPAVLSNQPATGVRRHFDCAPTVMVLPIPTSTATLSR